MKYPAILFLLVLTLTFTACPFKKKKELPPWTIYQKNTEIALQSLKTLQTLEFAETNLVLYKETLKNTETTIDLFLASNRTDPPRTSYLEIEAALQDFRLALELTERKRATAGDNFFAGKLFAKNDAKLFSRVQQRYKLGPELQTSSHSYYYIDPILHEALRSANNHIERASKKVKDEVLLEAKAAKAAKNDTKSDEKNLETAPTPLPSNTVSKPQNSP
ncbi:MAG: hypothetical protein FD167_3039 [bacterium]|nr:MAG: hypothetical protein FD167_3039 [bacterium]